MRFMNTKFSHKKVKRFDVKHLLFGAALAAFAFCPPAAFAQDFAAEETAADDPFGFDDSLDEQQSVQDLENSFRKEAFDKALETLLPLKPEEIRTLLEHYDRTVESTELPAHPYPRPELVVQNVSLDPGVPPLIVKLSWGYVTTISMLDSSGAPWEIEDISWVGDFLIQESTVYDQTHMLRISPESQYAHGNISMRLKGLNAPVILTFETNKDIVHYRFDAVVPRPGPLARTSIINNVGVSLKSGDADMSQALSGVMPRDAKRLSVSGVDGRTSAFIYNGLTYVRTPHTLLSPGWDSSVSSADGTRVYALEETPVILLSDRGRMVRARLTEREDLLDE